MTEQLKMTHHLHAACEEIFERKRRYGLDYPGCWRRRSIEKLRSHGVIEEKGCPGQVYFTETGLEWFLQNRGNRQ